MFCENELKKPISILALFVIAFGIFLSSFHPIHASQLGFEHGRDQKMLQLGCSDCAHSAQANDCLKHCLERAVKTSASSVFAQMSNSSFWKIRTASFIFPARQSEAFASAIPPPKPLATQAVWLLNVEKRE